MFARMIVAAALILGTTAAFASDASYDQAQSRIASTPAVQEKVTPQAPAPSTHVHAMACSCGM